MANAESPTFVVPSLRFDQIERDMLSRIGARAWRLPHREADAGERISSTGSPLVAQLDLSGGASGILVRFRRRPYSGSRLSSSPTWTSTDSQKVIRRLR